MMRRTRKTLKACSRALRGFSLGEAVLAVFLLTAGIVPIITSMVDGLHTSTASQELIIASGLAQEGVELVRNVRDNTVLGAHPAFDAFPMNSGGNNYSLGDCRISYGSSVLTDPSVANGIECGAVGANWYDLSLNATNFYFHGGETGKFKRKIYLMYDNASKAYDVASVVYWGTVVPANANNAAQLDTVLGFCVAKDKCIYSKSRLTEWAN